MNEQSPRQDISDEELDKARREAVRRVIAECRAAIRAGEARFRQRWKARG